VARPDTVQRDLASDGAVVADDRVLYPPLDFNGILGTKFEAYSTTDAFFGYDYLMLGNAFYSFLGAIKETQATSITQIFIDIQR